MARDQILAGGKELESESPGVSNAVGRQLYLRHKHGGGDIGREQTGTIGTRAEVEMHAAKGYKVTRAGGDLAARGGSPARAPRFDRPELTLFNVSDVSE